jgi:hypothetical protein
MMALALITHAVFYISISIILRSYHAAIVECTGNRGEVPNQLAIFFGLLCCIHFVFSLGQLPGFIKILDVAEDQENTIKSNFEQQRPQIVAFNQEV